MLVHQRVINLIHIHIFPSSHLINLLAADFWKGATEHQGEVLGESSINTHDGSGSGAGILMLTSRGYIDGIHGTPYIPYMDPSWDMWLFCVTIRSISRVQLEISGLGV